MIVLIIVIAVLALIFLVVDIVDINRFVIREYIVETDKIDKDCTFVLLADLHNRQFGKNNCKLLKAVEDISPDFICCAGDMVVAKPGVSFSRAIELMDNLKKWPLYYGMGNHEFRWQLYPEKYGNIYYEYIDELKKKGITVLENEKVDFGNRITIQGLMIDKKYYKRFERIPMNGEYIISKCGEFNLDNFNILIAHNPEYFTAYAEGKADLVLSGHVHGGIMRLPYIGGVISPRLGLFPRYTGGEYRINGSKMVLSCGLGCHTLPIRIFNPGELSVIHLKTCSK